MLQRSAVALSAYTQLESSDNSQTKPGPLSCAVSAHYEFEIESALFLLAVTLVLHCLFSGHFLFPLFNVQSLFHESILLRLSGLLRGDSQRNWSRSRARVQIARPIQILSSERWAEKGGGRVNSLTRQKRINNKGGDQVRGPFSNVACV